MDTVTTEQLTVEERRVLAELAKRRLSSFCEYTGEGTWQHADHLEVLCEKIEEAEQWVRGRHDEHKLIMVSMPPRHGKSQVVSRNAPAWIMGRNPEWEVIEASYGADLATDMSRDARQIFKEYAGPLFDLEIDPVVNATKLWKIKGHGGKLMAAGSDGPITGRGAHIAICFPAGTMIETSCGPVPIESFDSKGSHELVYWYDEEKRPVLRCANLVSKRESDGLYRITTTAGRVVEATGEHPFYVDGRYKQASALTPGDRLLCAVRSEDRQEGIRGQQAHQARSQGLLLFKRLCRAIAEVCKKVSNVWGASCERTAVLFDGVQAESSMDIAESPEGYAVRSVWEGIQPEPCGSSVLQPGMCGPCTRIQDAGEREPRMAQWRKPHAPTETCGEGVQRDTTEDLGKGWVSLRRLWKRSQASSPSHQPGCRGQSLDEPRDDVPEAPHAATRRGTIQTEEDTVALVECIRSNAVVYNLRVEGTKNFFANGILVHNCDDPIKGMEDAESPTMQRKLLTWLKTTLLTRLAPGGALIIVATRWVINDLIGSLLREADVSGMVWDNVVFPAIAVEDDALGRSVGDPLWPARFSLKQLEQIKKLFASDRLWQGPYQQDPTFDIVGALWKIELLNKLRVSQYQVPDLYRTIISWDPSMTSKKTSAEHGIVVCSMGAPFYAPGKKASIITEGMQHAYVREDLSGIYTPDEACEVVRDAYHRLAADKVIAEVNQGGDWIEGLLKKLDPTISYKSLSAHESKYARAEPVSALYEQLLIHHVGVLTCLENEQCTYTGPPQPSPNSYDAVVHGLAFLYDLANQKKRMFVVPGS